jgi:hypothetical protein
VATSPSGSTLYKVYPAALACGGVELDQCLVWLRVVQLINKPYGDREQRPHMVTMLSRFAYIRAAEKGKEFARPSKHIGGMASQIF